ncbi:PH domain-containing protein [Vallicoccus soli]|uniref:PH domain-containing protein n=1 Tax=Vallicoccus soli TaxID=2339232 RepID=A0A3A3Z0L7_9ACTN|nr:PH domain-containing protein [Vallicoccus soli]RJK96733.1 PH domain-containing protein [Vallicoccus soli]
MPDPSAPRSADALPALPLVLRPRTARRVLYPLVALVLVAFVGGALLLPGEGRGAFGPADRAGVVATGLAIAWVMHRIAAVRVLCRESGLRVVNVLRSRDVEWAEVLGVRLGQAAPWLQLDLSDGTTLAAMGVQGSDGEHARTQARTLARLVQDRSRTEHDR